MKPIQLILPLVATSLWASAPISSGIQTYLGMTDQFEEWDYVSGIPAEIDSRLNQITQLDTLFSQYRDLLSEWDALISYNSYESSWSEIEDLLDLDNKKLYGSLPEWDSQTCLKTNHHARSYDKWHISGTKKRFDISQVRPWNPELAPAAIATSWDQPISPSQNPSLNGYVDVPLNLNVNLFSNRLAITPYRELLDADRQILSRFITETIKNSFNLHDSDTPEETTDKMNRRLKHDVHVNSHVSYTPFAISGEHANFGMNLFTDVGITVPGDLLGIVFGSTLKEGTVLDISSLRAEAIVGTVLSAGGRSQRDVPDFLLPLLPTGEGWFWKQFNVDFITGLGYVDVRGREGTIEIDGEGTSYLLNGEADVYLAGTGLENEYEFSNPFWVNNLPALKPAGYGIGLDAGFQISDEKRTIQLQFSNVGAMRWRDVKKGRMAIHSDSLDMEGLVNEGEPGDIATIENDSLKQIDVLWRPLKTSFTLAGTQVLSQRAKRSAHGLYARQLRVFAEYNQAITPYAGCSFVPRLKTGIEDDFLMGAIGAGYFAIVGGSEGIGSGLTIRLFQNRHFSLNTEYMAYGSPILFPKRGVGLSLVTRFNRHPDKWYK